MVILKYELKRHRTYILGWAIALALCIFLMTPTYYSFLDAASVELFETMGTTDFYRSVGVSMEYLTSPLGIYGFLTSFFMIASGIFGMHFGMDNQLDIPFRNSLGRVFPDCPVPDPCYAVLRCNGHDGGNFVFPQPQSAADRRISRICGVLYYQLLQHRQ